VLFLVEPGENNLNFPDEIVTIVVFTGYLYISRDRMFQKLLLIFCHVQCMELPNKKCRGMY